MVGGPTIPLPYMLARSQNVMPHVASAKFSAPYVSHPFSSMGFVMTCIERFGSMAYPLLLMSEARRSVHSIG